MLRYMDRSTIHYLKQKGWSNTQIGAFVGHHRDTIAKEVGHNRRTVARVLREPVERTSAKRQRRSRVDPYRPHIERWIGEGLTAVRMLELAREDAEQPYTGSRSHFGEMVRRIRRALDQHQAAAEAPIRFEGLPAEYLQVDWGEMVRHEVA